MPGLSSWLEMSSRVTIVVYSLTPPVIQGRVESASCETDLTVPTKTTLGKASMRTSAFWPALIFLINDSWMLTFTCMWVMSGRLKIFLTRVDRGSLADLAGSRS